MTMRQRLWGRVSKARGAIGFLIAALAAGAAAAPDYVPSTEPKLAACAHYPVQALREGRSGDVVVDCVVKVDGHLSDCKVVEERPSGYGFAQAARCTTPTVQMTSGDSSSPHLRIPFHYEPKSAQPTVAKPSTL